MAYMNREDRRASIVEAAIEIAMERGLSAATVRGVANALGSASGQIHHHFSSAGELRAEAFRTWAGRLTSQWEERIAGLSCRDRLRAALTMDLDDRGIMDLRFWNEAADAARTDGKVRLAVGESMRDWIAMLSGIVERGREIGEFRAGGSSRDVAERLVALCLGLDEMNRIGVVDASLEDMGRHAETLIDLEVGSA